MSFNVFKKTITVHGARFPEPVLQPRLGNEETFVLNLPVRSLPNRLDGVWTRARTARTCGTAAGAVAVRAYSAMQIFFTRPDKPRKIFPSSSGDLKYQMQWANTATSQDRPSPAVWLRYCSGVA
ncbi:unnamed protein product [Clonostachys rhizophaga]|uniref:Uncharacterized protein n=1 Tax=Clonostachys rhizophaga TaxID=160324 RepID=A0A9N9VA38_9HYPO|nr:unnamed protein product [Clonostachys rhizophaga]